MHDPGISELGKFMTDFWQFIKRFYVPDADAYSPYWHDFIEEAGVLVRKYGNGAFEKKMVLAFMDYVEKKSYETETSNRP